MDKQKQREAMAVLDGCLCFENKFGKPFGLFSNRGWKKLSKYDSHDAVQPVIDGLTDDEYTRFLHYLKYMVGVRGRMRATPAQKVEAILKAKGLWED